MALALATPANADVVCKTSDIEIKQLDRRGPPAALRFSYEVVGELINHCGSATSAVIHLTFRDAGGHVVYAEDVMPPPGGVNIDPDEFLCIHPPHTDGRL